jgi:hypothetical protein
MSHNIPYFYINKNQMSTIFAKLACYGSVRMEGQELHAYFNFLKMELRNTVNEFANFLKFIFLFTIRTMIILIHLYVVCK